jgi:hypothetical protein
VRTRGVRTMAIGVSSVSLEHISFGLGLEYFYTSWYGRGQRVQYALRSLVFNPCIGL